MDDGRSSASPYSSTDPSFPNYQDWVPIVNTDLRKRHVVHVLQDRTFATRDPTFEYQNRDFRQYTHGDEVPRKWEVNAAGGFGGGVDVSEHEWNGSWAGDKTWTNVNQGVYNKARFVVQAAEKWNPSNVQLVKGGKYRIHVPDKTFGVSQRWNDTRITVDANGYSSHYDAISKCHVALGQCRSYLNHARRVPKSNWMSLVSPCYA
jgi:hypothetical protein